MKLATSVIGLQPDHIRPTLPRLAEHGVEGLVVAPTMVWGPSAPHGVTREQARIFKDKVYDAGITDGIIGMQSLTTGLQGAALSGSRAERQKLVEHLKRQAELAGNLGATSLIFGSPALRQGTIDRNQAIDVFRMAAGAASDNGATLCLEPLAGYGVTFGKTTREGMEFVWDVRARNPADWRGGVGLHLDSAGIAGDPNAKSRDILAAQLTTGITSFDASSPNIGPLTEDRTVDHEKIADWLRAAEYAGYVSVEVSNQSLANFQDPVQTYLDQIDFARKAYIE